LREVYQNYARQTFSFPAGVSVSDVASVVEIHSERLNAFYEGAKWQMDKQSDFIIGFLEFIEGTYSYSNIYDHWYLHADTSKTYSKKQLLEVYLKRNKL
jgi:hypothetical protein